MSSIKFTALTSAVAMALMGMSVSATAAYQYLDGKSGTYEVENDAHVVIGSANANVEAANSDVILEASDKTFKQIFVGGHTANPDSKDADVKNINVTVNGGSFANYYSGGRNADQLTTSTSVGKVVTVLNGVTVRPYGNERCSGGVLAGGMSNGKAGSVNSVAESVITVKGDSVIDRHIHGGGYGANQSTTTVEKSLINLESGTFNNNIYAGGLGLDGNNNKVQVGESKIAISGGQFKTDKAIYASGRNFTTNTVNKVTKAEIVFSGAAKVPAERVETDYASLNNAYEGLQVVRTEDSVIQADSNLAVERTDLAILGFANYQGAFKGQVKDFDHMIVNDGSRLEIDNLTPGAEGGQININKSLTLEKGASLKIDTFGRLLNFMQAASEEPADSFVFNLESADIQIGHNYAEDVKVSATGDVNDQVKGDIGVLLERMDLADEEGGVDQTKVSDIKVAAGKVFGEIVVDETGKIVKKKNVANESKGKMLTNVPTVLARTQMNELRLRMGEIRSTNDKTNGVWARYNGGRLAGANDLTADFNMVQLGIDTQLANNLPRVGVAFAYTGNEADDMFGSDVDSDMFTLSAYATWLADNGVYGDVIGRVAKVSTDYAFAGEKTDFDNYLYSFSGELGVHKAFNKMFFVEPSVEVTYANLSSEDFVMGDVKYALDETESLIMRAGFATGLNADWGEVYARAGVVHEFMGDTSIQAAFVSGGAADPIVNKGADTWFEYAIGANVNVGNNAYVYADIGQTDGANIDEDWRANVGVRYAF